MSGPTRTFLDQMYIDTCVLSTRIPPLSEISLDICSTIDLDLGIPNEALKWPPPPTSMIDEYHLQHSRSLGSEREPATLRSHRPRRAGSATLKHPNQRRYR